MTAYYNEHDAFAAEWLRNLISEGLLPPGEVDERDIRDVTPAELVRFTQCHFFAGIGLWPAALRRAGWPDDRPIWTGSCPCQPFSAAGSGAGFDDERHLWPHWFWLIWNCRPPAIAGEQVAGKDGLGWLDLVQDDLGGAGYTVGAVNLCAAGFGMDWRGSAESKRLERAIRLCPDPMVARHLGSFADWADQALAIGGFHIRQRLYFVGLADQSSGGRRIGRHAALAWEGGHLNRSGDASESLADRASERRERRGTGPAGTEPGTLERPQRLRDAGGLVDGERPGPQGLGGDGGPGDEPGRIGADEARPAAAAGASDLLADVDDDEQRQGGGPGREGPAGNEPGAEPGGRGSAGQLADCGGDGDRQHLGELSGDEGQHGLRPEDGDHAPVAGSPAGGVADGHGGESGDGGLQRGGEHGQQPQDGGDGGGRDSGPRAGPAGGSAADADHGEGGTVDWLFCRDGFWRAVEAGTFPLVNADKARVGKLRSIGNGLDFETATGFSEVVVEVWREWTLNSPG